MTPLKNNETSTPRARQSESGWKDRRRPPQVERPSLSGRDFTVRQLRKIFQPQQVKNVTETVHREPRQDSVLTPLAAPPQEPPRTFADDAYLKEQEEIKELKQLHQSIPSNKVPVNFLSLIKSPCQRRQLLDVR